MAKLIKVSDEVYEELRRIRDENDLRSFDVVIRRLLKVYKGEPKYTNTVNQSTTRYTEVKQSKPISTNEVNQSVQRSTEVYQSKAEYTDEDDIDMDTFDYLTSLLYDLKHKHGKRYITDADIEKIKDQLINDKNVILSTNKIIEILSREGYIKRAGKKYEITL